MFDRKHRPSDMNTSHLVAGVKTAQKPSEQSKRLSENRIKQNVNRQFKELDDWANNRS